MPYITRTEGGGKLGSEAQFLGRSLLTILAVRQFWNPAHFGGTRDQACLG